ncbi:hypothetical protein BDZ90DRAFT_37000 [Jaminaea rosea]|uniref:Uncharacterized protein n=1 Tax=Jaminaea rosea TaxID=1569628 RepID=A0A316V0Z9_9BASI|nr:hypothetical protein BDZ90DRAFT_37000 [Jaminaea rosea]PWN31152.1 hypothetical protein BDZ90DRAFT_37000 [Jaminaea rosea]
MPPLPSPTLQQKQHCAPPVPSRTTTPVLTSSMLTLPPLRPPTGRRRIRLLLVSSSRSISRGCPPKEPRELRPGPLRPPGHGHGCAELSVALFLRASCFLLWSGRHCYYPTHSSRAHTSSPLPSAQKTHARTHARCPFFFAVSSTKPFVIAFDSTATTITLDWIGSDPFPRSRLPFVRIAASLQHTLSWPRPFSASETLCFSVSGRHDESCIFFKSTSHVVPPEIVA